MGVAVTNESASGRLVEGILASIAEFYSANLSQEIYKGLTEKARQGRWPTLAPVGYRNVWTDVGGRTGSIIVIDEPRAKLVREAVWLYATGDWSLATLAEEMGGRGLHGRSGKALPRSKMAELLKNRAHRKGRLFRSSLQVGRH